MKAKAILVFLLLYLLLPNSAKAFLYSNPGFPNSQFNSENMLQNGWFKGSDCKPSSAGWQQGNSPPYTWGFTDKNQDPTDSSCPSSTGFAARFADSNYHQGNAILYQVVPANPTSKTLHFHALIVAHRVDQYKAEIYGSNSPNGPWTSVWIPFNIEGCLSQDCVNEMYGAACNTGDRICLWDDVTEDVLGSLSPITKTISQGYSYYKVEFVMNYPPESNIGAGDNGGKLARVFFKVSGGSGNTSTPTPGYKPGDANGDGKVDGLDYVIWLNYYGKTISGGANNGDFNNDTKVDGLDYVIWLTNYGK